MIIFLTDKGRRSIINYASTLSVVLKNMLKGIEKDERLAQLRADEVLDYIQDAKQLVKTWEEDTNKENENTPAP
ncbi:MAG: hypothetical protein ACFFBD_05030 [Candidatus Hodarchaeota archaeon]